MLLHSANIAIRNRVIAYEKGTVVQGTVTSVEIIREQDSDGVISSHLCIKVGFNNLLGAYIIKQLTDGQFYKKTDFQVGQPIELCIYNDYVLVN